MVFVKIHLKEIISFKNLFPLKKSISIAKSRIHASLTHLSNYPKEQRPTYSEQTFSQV